MIPHSFCRKHGYTEDVKISINRPAKTYYKCRICSIERDVGYAKSPRGMEVRRKIARKEIFIMSDRYIKILLRGTGKLLSRDIPIELVDLKRQQIALKRIAKENK
jgi:hypothetical protein